MKKILEELEDVKPLDTEQIISEFFDYYEQHDRHKYHEITVYLIAKFKRVEDGEIIDVILENLKSVLGAVEQKCNCAMGMDVDRCLKVQPPDFKCDVATDGECERHKWLYRKLSKLYDHISLEYTRLGDIRQHNDQIENLIGDVEKKEIELGETVENINKKTSETTESIEKFEKKMDGMQKDYITILGIFASIVLAFTGGIAFSTSVLENIDAVSPYRLALVVDGVAAVFINIMYILVWFIQSIHGSSNLNYPAFMWGLNIAIVIAAIITIACWSYGVADIVEA